MSFLYLDTETYSDIPINHGTHVYATSVEVMLVPWAIDDGPVQVWDRTADTEWPAPLQAALVDPSVTVVIHNSHFDRNVLRYALHVDIPTERIHDTMVQALAHGLPAGLADLCEVFRLEADKAKDKAGKKLIQLFCKPLPANRKLRRATAQTHPAEWEAFKAYAASDIEAMRSIKARMPMINMGPKELALWRLDQKINDRGVAIDMDLVHAALTAIGHTQRELGIKAREMTRNEVANATQRDALLAFIFEEFGMHLPDLQGATIDKVLRKDDLPPELRALLIVRQQASTTSTSKYRTLARATSADGRLRGTLQFNGASRTGRWAGRLFQPQNLPRPSMKQRRIDAGIEALKAGCAQLVEDDIMALTSNVIRGTIIAPPGRKLVVADLSNIEGRVQAWLAGEEWKLDAFRAFDAKTGPDLYKLAYAKSFGVRPEDVDKDQRQVGKVQELALAYAGGVGAFVTFADVYKIQLEDLASRVLVEAPEALVKEADGFYEWMLKIKGNTYNLSPHAFEACDTLKRGWRQGHPAISSYWAELEQAAKNAVLNPGEEFPARKVVCKATKNWLFIRMPSGRSLCYPAARVMDEGLTYTGTDQFTRKWVRIQTHGGKLFENLCQAVARDIMAEHMPAIEGYNYTIDLTVHDELICETPDSPEFNADQLAAMMATPPDWAPDIPLAAAGFDTYRYRKE